MSSSGEPRPVVVLTAGGVGRTKPVPKKKAPSKASPPPESRESSDSFLDQEVEEQAPFVDEPVVSSQDEAPHGSSGAAAGTSFGKVPFKANNAILTSKPHGRATSTGSMTTTPHTKKSELFWLLVCFLGIMASFVCYGLLLEYATSGGRKLHELSFLFVTSGLYTVTAAAGRYVRDETPTSIPPARFAILGLTSMGSTFFSVRSLRYVSFF